MRRYLVGGAGIAVTAATLMAIEAAPTTATSHRAEDPPPLVMQAGADSVTVWKYGKRVDLDLGTYAVAGNDPFEIRATRKSYHDPVEAVWRGPDGDVALPEGSVGNFRGLIDFYKLTVKDADGKTVVSRKSGFCPSGDTVRVRPDAPAVSRYPWDCGGGMPFKIGAVWGFEAGHGIPFPEPYGTSITVPPGRYVAQVAITKKYRELFGIPESDATATVKVRVRRAEDCEGPGCRDDGHAMHHSAGHRMTSMDGNDRNDNVVRPGERPTGPQRVPAAGPKPDLRSVPAWGIRVRSGKYLAFSATVWNAGNSPLVVDGFRRKNEALMDAYQYFFNADGDQVGYDEVGSMEWDPRPNHHHWHFRDFARYRLVDADKEGVVRSKKEAFCLANTDAVDYTVDGANWQPGNTDLHTACGEKNSLGLREVLDSGSGDTYAQFRPGQSFVLKGIPNGTYYIEVRANPVQNLVESDTSNNTAYRKVILKGKPGARTVTVPPVGLVDHR
ncbi:MAG: lysyl oxidase family protein [Nocardioidaceae bacterium]